MNFTSNTRTPSQMLVASPSCPNGAVVLLRKGNEMIGTCNQEEGVSGPIISSLGQCMGRLFEPIAGLQPYVARLGRGTSLLLEGKVFPLQCVLCVRTLRDRQGVGWFDSNFLQLPGCGQ